MPFFSQLTRSIGSAIRSVFSAGKATQTRKPAPGKPVTGTDSPGRSGPNRTVEVDPRKVGAVRMSYSPVRDGNPDPGEIVWTWVPFEENNGQGKDRPVLVVAAEKSGTLLVVQLTSKKHEGRSDFVSVGAGAWDGQHRESFVNLDRVLRVHPGGMRREAAALDRTPFQTVTKQLQSRYGWR